VLAAERRELVRQSVGAGQGSTVAGLAAQLSVSRMTIRRDLVTLAREGKLARVHGGALPLAARPAASFAQNVSHRFAEKDRIGAAAAELVRDGETLLLDVGTTVLHLARHLRGRSLRVITANLGVLETLLAEPSIELILLGGVVNRHYASLGGFLAEESLLQVRADRAFISAAGIRDDLSVLDDTAVDVRIKRGMIAAAAEVILLADSEKFGEVQPVRVCGPGDIGVLVTDRGAPQTLLAAFEAAGVRVMRA
jgi:DeoR/GlpR family transcriptional regulator of sugar metabolism